MTSSSVVLDLWGEPLFRKFLGEVRRKCGVVETLALPSMRDLPTIQIETLFVPPLLSVVAVDADTAPESWPEGENLLAAFQQHAQIVVLGDPGGGKTTLSNWLAWRLTSGATAPLPSQLDNKIPIPCILRDMPVECFSEGQGIVDLAVAVASKLMGESTAQSLRPLFNEWVKAGQYVLILDGIDEIPVSRRATVAGWMREAHRQGACALATSRIVGYEDYPVDSFVADSVSTTSDEAVEIKRESASAAVSFKIRNKGYSFKTESGPVEVLDNLLPPSWAQLRYLMPFDQPRITDFARNWYRQRCVTDIEAKQKTSDLLAALAQSEVTLKLARTPNLLSLMAIVHRERAHLPDGKALLYDEIVNAYLNTIDKQRKIGPDDLFAQYGWKERKTWLAYVGFKMQEARGWNSRGAGILVTQEEVLSWLKEAMTVSGVADCQFVANEFLNWVARRSGLLLPRGENRYAFVHLSFQEYFCACYVAGCIVRPAFVMDKLPASALVTKLRLSAWATTPSWTETLIFLFELLSAEHDPEWVENLIEIVHDVKRGRTAVLAARLIKNKHVKLSRRVHDLLADGCVSWVFHNWDPDVLKHSDVTKTLIDSGHCALFSDFTEEEVAAQASQGISIGAWEETPSRVRVLIVGKGCQPPKAVIQSMPNLKAVIFESSSVLDFNDISGLKKIQMMRLSAVGVIDFGLLGEHSALEYLRIYEIDTDDLSPVAQLKKLRSLELCNLPVKDVSAIGECKKLSFLMLRGLETSDLRSLAKLKKVETLVLDDLPVADIACVSEMKKLQYIHLCSMPVEDITPLGKCVALENVDLESILAPDLSPLAKLKNLEGVLLRDIPVRSISPLAGMSQLNYLFLRQLPLDELNPLRECRGLTSIYLYDLPVKDVEFLAGLHEVKILTLTRLPVTDVSALAGLKNLTYLDMYGIEAEDLSVLAQLPSLTNFATSEDSGYDLRFLQGNEKLKVSLHSDEQRFR